MIRKATEKDIEGIARIYDAIHTLEERGTITVGWRREAYPTVLTAKDHWREVTFMSTMTEAFLLPQ